MDEPRGFKRSQFAVVLVLVPLNETFERKYLVVPFAPYVMKLGRQTTAKSAAGPDNGYFDSRVLSRQHAEIWADRETGKVWIKDCKSSNGTYINKKRLSAENTESEPHELRRNDSLDLGIDIISNEESKQVYKRISARVEKVSMLPLNVGLQQRLEQEGRSATPAATPPTPGPRPNLARSPSLETLRAPSNSDAIFGVTLESLALSHANSAAGGDLVRDSVRSHIDFELTAKRLVSEIRAVRADTAKMKSINTLLEDIRQASIEAEARDRMEKQDLEEARHKLELERLERRQMMKSSSMAALKAENTLLKTELAYYTGRGKHERRTSRTSHPRVRQEAQRGLQKISRGHVANNVLVMIGTTILVTISGIWIMYFFTPPVVPQKPAA